MNTLAYQHLEKHVGHDITCRQGDNKVIIQCETCRVMLLKVVKPLVTRVILAVLDNEGPTFWASTVELPAGSDDKDILQTAASVASWDGYTVAEVDGLPIGMLPTDRYTNFDEIWNALQGRQEGRQG